MLIYVDFTLTIIKPFGFRILSQTLRRQSQKKILRDSASHPRNSARKAISEEVGRKKISALKISQLKRTKKIK